MQAVLDTNVVVSAAISPRGPSAEIIKAWRAHSFTWVTSPALLDELERTLRAPRLKRYVAWSGDEITEFLDLVRRLALVVSPARTIDAVKDDPDDNRVLEAAVAAPVDYVVSGDRDLLSLGSFEEIAIIPPARLVAIIATGLT